MTDIRKGALKDRQRRTREKHPDTHLGRKTETETKSQKLTWK